MQAQNDILLFMVSSALLVVVLVGLIIKMQLFNKKQQAGYLEQVELIKSNFEKELFETRFEIQEEAFELISLELHDNVGHYLSLAKLHLTSFRIRVPAEVTEKVEAATVLIAHSLDEIRNISKGLNKEQIKSHGLIKTVQQQIDQLNRFEQFKATLIITGRTRYLDDLKEIILFRIIQESLNNIVRHSGASLINIGLHYDEDKLQLTIHDNGIGFKIKNSSPDRDQHSFGLKNIIKRSSLINAIPQIISSPGKGTTINIITPY